MISRLLLVVAMSLAVALPAKSETRIEEVTSPKGIKAWLVHDTTLPIVALEFAFRGGAVQDAKGRDGTANMVSGLLDEGAGELKAQEFQSRLEDSAVELSFDTRYDSFFGSLRTLSANEDEAFDLLKLAVTSPRFDQDAIDRIRAQVMARIRQNSTNPEALAHYNFQEQAFPGHPYGREVEGTAETVTSITRDDLVTFHRNNFARDNLVVTAVGAIDAETLGRRLDEAFGDLPATAEITPAAPATLTNVGTLTVVEMDTPQTAISFGRPGPLRKNEDFMAYYVLNHILGGGTFTSRLFNEVREKRGLSYGVFTGLFPLSASGYVMGQVATRNDRAGEAVSVIRDEFRKLAAEPPSEEEIAKAKKYLIGSFALRFDSSNKIARNLLQFQIDNLGIDFINERNALIEAVTREDLARAAKSLLGDGELLVVAVGKPEGLESTGTSSGDR
ncbi:peptidase M16 [Agaricicola taiwanensis]|uniref:Peptidase M16 n=1 Tax=Agaricicola taiwanensis TaxID=591372 RepID=A0A8J2VKD2_9RHOB|nr:pitrilysin family protein [Agaricicola taiwanensis]GGE34288.1 peptidase M16 [Agaricicola taiwanensis]